MTTVAVIGDGQVVAESFHPAPRRHAEMLAPAIQEVLVRAQIQGGELTGIAVGVGPGAFTGLRVGLATATSLGNALQIPVHGVMTLDAMAFETQLAQPFTVVVDARRKEVFWATYTNYETRATGPFVSGPDEITAVTDGDIVGAAATPFAQLTERARAPDAPSAGSLGLLAFRRLNEGRALLTAQPLYLRHPDVSPAAAPKSVLS